MVLLAGGVWWSRRGSAPESPTVDQGPPAPATTPTSVPAPATSPTSESAITTTRTVWVRVTADGERVIERELPANARVPLKAQKTIVLRTGDAGAVRVLINGEDQGPLGGNGEVVTRTFSVK